jgi:hypothetical protein
MNRFARRITATLAAVFAVIWASAVSASAMPAPLPLAPGPVATSYDAYVVQTHAPTTTTDSLVPWLLAAALATVVALVLIVATRGITQRQQGTPSVS